MVRLKLAAALVLLFLGMTASVAQAAQEIVFLPGKTLGMTPPPGFEVSKTFSGFLEPSSGSSILVVELPVAAHKEIKAGMTVEALAQKSIKVTSQEDIKISGYVGILLKGIHTGGEKQVRKWILLVATDEATLLVTAQDLSGSTLDDAKIATVFESIRVRQAPTLQVQMEALPFAVDDLAGYRAVRTFASHGLLLTIGPKDIVQDGSQPVVMIQRPMERPFPTDVFPADLSDKLLRSVKSFDVVSVGDTVAQNVAGAGGHETIATARDKVLKVELVVAQWLRLDSGQQLHVLAILPQADHAALLPGVRKLVAQLSLK